MVFGKVAMIEYLNYEFLNENSFHILDLQDICSSERSVTIYKTTSRTAEGCGFKSNK
jgi:hypothetical protein